MTSPSRNLPAARYSRAFFVVSAIMLLLSVELTRRKSLAEAAVTAACAGIASARDCGDGEVMEACALRGLSVSPVCYCADRLARYCSDVCGVDSETLLCLNSCPAYVERMQNNCSPPDTAVGWPSESVAIIAVGSVIGLAALAIATSVVCKCRAVTGEDSRPVRCYLWFLHRCGRRYKVAGHPVEPVNNFPAYPTDANVVGNNRNSAAVPLRTVRSRDSVDGPESEVLEDLIYRSV